MNMYYDINDIRKLRKVLRLTQRQLAKISGLSQSYIAKIESGSIDPSYSKVQQIFKALESMKPTSPQNASAIMNNGLIWIYGDASVKEAVRVMHESSISQMPVFDRQQRVVGSISERSMVEAMGRGKDIRKLEQMKVSDVMEPPFPLVDEVAPIELVAKILTFYSAVLVTKKGKVIGIITRSDLLRA
ncbi:MAG: CBS domain-containing protein [Nitrososphaerota archaeon]|jgi:predicted transcriptional regulator|nr:CBS domain-containing protein [Nitrososphaerota archaeon]MDG6927418.1 CBS domain-containing protein [Nitrososphaerota archaeon]MDG6931222.1 CBS domain-containing protein [Nitrososphaerota archaeon]MDG6931885.1 CBS domain-containing protein [Nitrososphaerota archaeon]MDG6936595.1 CBS domain-containing protein [Nitrososphaerota archaeon]